MGAIKSPVCSKGHPFKERGKRQVCLICEREYVKRYRVNNAKRKGVTEVTGSEKIVRSVLATKPSKA